jgi:hypothetical protein
VSKKAKGPKSFWGLFVGIALLGTFTNWYLKASVHPPKQLPDGKISAFDLQCYSDQGIKVCIGKITFPDELDLLISHSAIRSHCVNDGKEQPCVIVRSHYRDQRDRQEYTKAWIYDGERVRDLQKIQPKFRGKPQDIWDVE